MSSPLRNDAVTSLSPSLENLLSSLPDTHELMSQLRPYTHEHIARSWALTLRTLLVVAAAFAVALSNLPFGVRVIVSVATGFFMVRLFTIYHDYMHGAILRDSKIAHCLMYVLGSLLLRPSGDWRRSHNFHHQQNSVFKTSSVGSFPLMTLDEYNHASPGRRFYYRLARSPLIIITGYITCFLLQTFRRVLEDDKSLRLHALVALALHTIIVCAALRAGWDSYFLGVLIPFSVACATGAYLFYIQHNFEGVLFLPPDDWKFKFASLKSSSCLKASRVTHWLTGNIGYHHIHHLNPKVPFYRLPEAMKAIPALQSPTFVNLSPRSIYRGFQLKLWCPESEQMLPFSAASKGTRSECRGNP